MNLPNSFITAISKYNIDQDHIIFAATADFDMDYRFADTIIALTKEKLIIAAYPYREKAEYHMGGYGSRQISTVAASNTSTGSKSARTTGSSAHQYSDTLLTPPALQFYDLARVEKLEVLRQISTGVLLTVIDGTERNLCQFSNTRMGAFLRLCKVLDKVKKGEEILPEDLDVEKGK